MEQKTLRYCKVTSLTIGTKEYEWSSIWDLVSGSMNNDHIEASLEVTMLQRKNTPRFLHMINKLKFQNFRNKV